MENILFVSSAIKMNYNALEFAVSLAEITHSELKGFFLEKDMELHSPVAVKETTNPVIDGDILGAPDIIGFEMRQQKYEKNALFFKNYCDKRTVPCSVHHIKGDSLQETVFESRFADLIITGIDTSFIRNDNECPSQFVEALLQKSECPIVLAPEHNTDIDEIIFAYDGSASSVFAIKQFTYLFPVFENKRIMVVQAAETPFIKDRQRISELLKGYYSQISYEMLKGNDPSNELFEFLRRRKNLFVVMGAYGRSNLSRLFKKSVADPIIKRIALPIFITHS